MDHIKVYFQASSIHGFPYIVNRDLHFEKILWSTALVVSFICCGLLIFKIAVKFEEDATVTYTSDTAVPVTEVVVWFVKVAISIDLFPEDSIPCRDLLS
jgi:hypothetical protein